MEALLFADRIRIISFLLTDIVFWLTVCPPKYKTVESAMEEWQMDACGFCERLLTANFYWIESVDMLYPLAVDSSRLLFT